MAALPPLRPADAAPLHVSQLLALTGAAALQGDAFRNGVEMAVQEINAGGGLLGRQVRISTFDTQSSPQGARAAAARALEGGPLALLGPVATAETLAVAPMARERRVMQVTAAELPALPAPGEPMLLLAGPGQAIRMATLARWVQGLPGVRRVALLAAEGQGGAVAQFAAACRARGLAVTANLVLPPGHAEPAAAIARVVASQADALFIAAGGAMAGHIIAEARRQAPALVLFGEAGLAGAAALRAAGPAAAGLYVPRALAPDAPMPALEAFHRRFQALYHQAPDAVAMQGYIALAMVQTAVRRLGQPTAPLLAEALRTSPVREADAPGILLDTAWNPAGEADRVSFMTELQAGGTLSWSTLPPLRG